MKRGSGGGLSFHVNDVDASVSNCWGSVICQNVGKGHGMNVSYSDFLLSKQNIFLYAFP